MCVGRGGGHNFNNNKEHCDPDILTVECVNLHFTSMFSEFLIRRFSILDLIHFWVMITCLAASSGSAPYFIWGGARCPRPAPGLSAHMFFQ